MSTFFLHSSPPQLLISSLKCQFYKYCNRWFSHIQICPPMTIPYSPLIILLSHFNQQKVSNPTHHRSNRAWNISHGYLARLFKRSHRVWRLDGTSQITSDFLCRCPAEGREKPASVTIIHSFRIQAV